MHIAQLQALEDNFIYILVDTHSQTASVVDPTQAKPVLDYLATHKLHLTSIWNTHHHGDHVGGNLELKAHYPQVAIYGGAQDKGRIPGQTHFLKQGDTVTFENVVAHILFVPGHTRGHIVYYVPDLKAVFVGDTLFSGGCGKLFEGTYEQMLGSLEQIRGLPDDTRVYCAHEYTVKNYEVLQTLEPHNELIAQRLSQSRLLRRQGQYTVPFLLGDEKKQSSFLRWDDKNLQAHLGTTTNLDTFTAVRQFRDQY